MTTLLCAFSDWHIGREDMPTYERAMQLPERILNHPMLPRNVDAVALAFIGDLIDGVGVFPGQYALNSTTLPEQFELTDRAARHNIAEFAKFKPGNTFAYLERGNHARLGGKFGHPHDNLEGILYDRIANEMRDVATIYPPDDNDVAVVEIENTVGIISHGCNGAAKHIETPAQRARALSEVYEYGASWTLYGHLHHIGITSQGFWFFRNGTLQNRGERHAASLKLFDSPRQLCLIIDDDRVIGSFWVEF